MPSPKADMDDRTTPPSPSFLRRIEIATIDAAAKLLGIPDKPKHARIVDLTPAQQERLREIEAKAVANFTGDLSQLEAALGMLRMGHYFGWKVLYMIHSKKTIRTYEDILDIRIREEFEDRGPSSYRSIGLAIAERYTNFWKVAGGDIKIPKRKDAAD